ncbi:uncharacterized protein Tco025E_07990 [Trypanosoma conorhini]|uniref:Uncharacterized protein n=1 Tax=Trypanosoma conorhini TaxID=83891 RepID=A0A422NFM7_9TRYP|nr:uncharacterized protein Tco025E_07990 [Trypanosoma conorhini]RNF04272.1 hypothetical protein Tco025E_07990 [Trypanosoma conorhini]
MEKVAEKHLPPHALARSLVISAAPSRSICPRRAMQVTPRGRLDASNRSAPGKNDHATTVKRERRGRCQRFLGTKCVYTASAPPPNPSPPGAHVGRVRCKGRARQVNHAVVRKQLVCEETPERCSPVRPDNPNSSWRGQGHPGSTVQQSTGPVPLWSVQSPRP